MNIIEHNKNGLVYLTADGFEAAGGVAHGFSTRLGGVSEGIYATLNLGMNRGDAPDRVRENYRRFCAAIGADMGNIVCASQVHGDTVRTVTAADLGIGLDEPEPWQADGLVTDIPGVTRAVYSADCLPILLYDPVHRAIAAIHSGWRGTALGIVQKTVEAMGCAFGTSPAHLRAAIGPCISQCCFETDYDVPSAMIRALGDAGAQAVEQTGMWTSRPSTAPGCCKPGCGTRPSIFRRCAPPAARTCSGPTGVWAMRAAPWRPSSRCRDKKEIWH